MLRKTDATGTGEITTDQGLGDYTKAREAQVMRLLNAFAPGKWELVPGHTQLTGLGDRLNGTVMIQAKGGMAPRHVTKYLSVQDGVLQTQGLNLQTPWFC